MRIILFLLYCLFVGSISQGAEDETKKAVELLASLPTQAMLNKAQKIIKDNEAATAEEKQSAENSIAKAKLVIPQLRKLITVNSSVFDYPGLLGRGTIQWYDPSYTLYMGVYLRSHQGTEPFDMKITFDKTGKILAVEDVIWKN